VSTLETLLKGEKTMDCKEEQDMYEVLRNRNAGRIRYIEEIKKLLGSRTRSEALRDIKCLQETRDYYPELQAEIRHLKSDNQRLESEYRELEVKLTASRDREERLYRQKLSVIKELADTGKDLEAFKNRSTHDALMEAKAKGYIVLPDRRGIKFND